MKRKSIVLALSCWLAVGTAANAESVSFTPDPSGRQGSGRFVAEIPVNSIGSLALPQGLAVFNGNVVEIDAVPDWLFDRTAVLTGAVIHTSMTTSGANAIIK